MRIDKKILMIAISIMLVFVVIVGCINQQTGEISEVKIPSFNFDNFVSSFNWRLERDSNISGSMIHFNLKIENPTNKTIAIQIAYCNIMDTFGNTLLSFKPTVCPYINYINALTSDSFNLESHQNMTFTFYKLINENNTNIHGWKYLNCLDSYPNYVSISGLYKLDNELRWFESNFCEINMPI